MFRYLADAAQFEECLTGRSYPVAMEGDYLALERAYLALPKAEPGGPVMASFDAEIVQRPPMEGPRTVPTVVVRRFVGLWPSQTCERAMSHASLSPQYWRIVSLRGAPVGPVAGSREPHLILRGQDGGYSATAGCDRFNGAYHVAGRQITFEPAANVAACRPPLPEQQRCCSAARGRRPRLAAGSKVICLPATWYAPFEAVAARSRAVTAVLARRIRCGSRDPATGPTGAPRRLTMRQYCGDRLAWLMARSQVWLGQRPTKRRTTTVGTVRGPSIGGPLNDLSVETRHHGPAGLALGSAR